ncbi:MAG: 2-phosphosulfolactate phosphatase [Gemmatimonadetes bacterium]|nr:2-phosphosulfolactate phosphatase [Gemmatimonadota bacterium]
MKLQVAFSPEEPIRGKLDDQIVVVIDVLRATTTILEALAAGARAVIPVESVEAAVRKKDELGREGLLLCGERRSRPIPGFDLGNSPREFTPEHVSGRTLLMTTTNGTGALRAGAAGRVCLVASFRNADAAVGAVAEAGADATLLCAGREGRFAIEDAICAGVIARRLAHRGLVLRTDDAARAAMLMARRFEHRLPWLLPRTAAGRRLARAGFADDIPFSAELDRHPVVPRFRDHLVTL